MKFYTCENVSIFGNNSALAENNRLLRLAQCRCLLAYSIRWTTTKFELTSRNGKQSEYRFVFQMILCQSFVLKRTGGRGERRTGQR